jgi:hypothetical protein
MQTETLFSPPAKHDSLDLSPREKVELPARQKLAQAVRQLRAAPDAVANDAVRKALAGAKADIRARLNLRWPDDTCRPCPRCGGDGETQRFAKARMHECPECEGACYAAVPDYREILRQLVASSGKNKGRLRASRPPAKLGGRVYFVWRWARFNGGADMCLPVTAEWELGEDPYRPELEVLAEIVASAAFGTRTAGARRWGSALGYNVDPVDPGDVPIELLLGAPGHDIGDVEDSPEYHMDRWGPAEDVGPPIDPPTEGGEL